jgi:hypothetical protein
MPVAFACAAGYSAENTGVIALGDGDFDVRAALESGDGVIVVPDEDTPLIARLDDYVALKRTRMSQKAQEEKLAEIAEEDEESSGSKSTKDKASSKGKD